MTRLEEEIKQAMVIASWENVSASETVVTASAAAEVAKRYIEKAFDDARIESGHLSTAYKYAGVEQWLKENGVI